MTNIQVRKALTTAEGEGAEVNRLMPIAKFRNFDPFVLWDHFTIEPGSGFPDHPHRGFEAITYLFQGAIEHADNLGNRSTVTAGGAQRFTAGRGIVHSEMPGVEGQTRGIQLWINLPRRLKTIEPEYQQVDAENIPQRQIEKGKLREIVGENGPVRLLTPVKYFDLTLDAKGVFEEAIPVDFRGFVYIVQGEATIHGQQVQTGEALFMEDMELLTVVTNNGCRAMVCFGRPHHEPIHQWGPFVD